MALNSPRSRPWLSRLHLLARLAGLFALLAALVGLVLAHVQGLLDDWRAAADRALSALRLAPEGDGLSVTALYLLLGGLAVSLLVLLGELVITLRKAALRRGASQLNSLLQVSIAAGLLVCVNLWAFNNHARIDCTRDQRFTFEPELRDELSKLRGQTTLVVLLQGRRLEPTGDRRKDNEAAAYEAAAEAVLVEKVRDLADQLRQLSSQRLRVVVLDTRKKEYRSEFQDVTKDAPALADAVSTAPESSLLFHTKDERGTEHVQRMNFDGFLQLDRTASRQGEGNLVLLNKGIRPIVRRLINLEERRPRAAVLVPETLLSTRGSIGFFAMKKMREALNRHGFEVRDILLRNENTRDLATASYDEVRVPQLRNSLAALNESLPEDEQKLRDFEKMLEVLRGPNPDLEKFRRDFNHRIERGAPAGPALQKRLLAELPLVIDQMTITLDLDRKRQQEETEELKRLNEKQARVQARISDEGGKLELLLADCDLLIIPRYTRVPQGFTLGRSPSQLFRLNETQTAAVKDFLKAGKPVLACLGPTNEMGDPRTGLPPDRNDGLEKLLGEVGVRFSRQTVLFDVQRRDFLSQDEEDFQRGRLSPVPGVSFEAPAGAGRPNPLGESLRLAGTLSDADLDVQLAYARPVTFDPFPAQRKRLSALMAFAPTGPLGAAAALSVAPDPAPPAWRGEFLFTVKGNNWNENSPFPRRAALNLPPEFPRFQPPATDDPLRGTPDEPRRGPFALGVAVETTVPWEWFQEEQRRPTPLRVAAIGHGGLFVDETWSPAREKLLLDSCNWLLGRDDLLNRDERPEKPETEWKYPRLALVERDRALWKWGAWGGLSFGCAFVGVLVLLVRRTV